MQQLQRALSLLYPDQCILCEARVDQHGGLCGSCWSQMPFLTGLVCHTCGVSLPGTETHHVLCDDCLATPRPWEAGRAALTYRDAARRVVLSFKHADRLDLAPACAAWMVQAGQDILSDDTLIVPVPAHWSRLVKRRYNQAVELSRGIARKTGLDFAPDALRRTKRTPTQDGKTVEERFANLHGAIEVSSKGLKRVRGRKICLVDDVMTSGATLSVATNVLYEAGAEQVCTLVLARVEKAP